MKKYFIFIPLLLTACVSYTGVSGADKTLTNDVMKHIKLIELGNNCKNIQSVHREIIASDAQKNTQNELWTVKACGKDNQYIVSMRSSSQNGTFFSVKQTQ